MASFTEPMLSFLNLRNTISPTRRRILMASIRSGITLIKAKISSFKLYIKCCILIVLSFGPLNLLKQLNVHVIIVGLLFLYICVVLAAELVFKADEGILRRWARVW